MNKKIFCVLLCILLCITALTGCGNDKTDDTVSTVGQNDTTQEIVQTEDGIYIMLYMLNENSWDTEIDANTEDADAELMQRNQEFLTWDLMKDYNFAAEHLPGPRGKY